LAVDCGLLAASGLDSGLLAGSGLNFVSAQQIKIQAELFPNANPNLILQKNPQTPDRPLWARCYISIYIKHVYK